jgi:hypothetical protein
MKHTLRLALALIVALTTLLAPLAHAQGGPPAGAPRGAGPTALLQFQGQVSSYIYWDADYTTYGPGSLTVNTVGSDPYTGTTLITVQIMQGAGRNFYGSGVSVGGMLFFSIGSYFFQCNAPGWGSYHVSGNPGSVYWVYLE